MACEPLLAVYDACVLYPFHLRNLLIQCAFDQLVEARWTDEIHEEWIRNLLANDPTISAMDLYDARDLMNAAVPNASVTEYADLIESIVLPDPDDRHVVAAAIRAGASVIVTWNVRDFPEAALQAHGTRAETPDELLTRLYDESPDAMIQVASRARRNLRKSRVSAEEFVKALQRQRLELFTSRIGKRFADL